MITPVSPNEELYRALVHTSPDSFMFSDFNGCILLANQSSARMGGFNSPDEIIGLNLFDFIADKDKAFIAQRFEMLARGVSKGTIEANLLRKDGTTYAAELTGSLIRDEKNSPIGLLSITRDITDRKAMEKVLADARDLAERANHLKDAFISNISHEIRTPLNAILGFTELIKEAANGKLSDEENRYFQIIDISCQRLMHTVELMLDLSKLQTGMFTSTTSLIDPDLVIKNLITEFQPVAKKKALSLTYINQAGPVQFFSDAFCIRETVSTLLHNAIKYTLRGRIDVTLSREPENELLLEVADTGIGMHPDFISRIFEPFSQEETGITKKYTGIGLSLSIAKKLLIAIGAEISVVSSHGKGSTFSIRIPIN